MSRGTQLEHIGTAGIYRPVQPKNDGPSFWGWAVIVFIGLLLLGQCAG